MPAKVLPARHLPLRNLSKIVVRDAVTTPVAPPTIKLANPGDLQLYSFSEPALVAGTYQIEVSQNVKVPNLFPSLGAVLEDVPVDGVSATTSIQPFEVLAPQFSIDPKEVHSTYPPQGHGDQPGILPHIVLNTAQLPWERRKKNTSNIPIADDDIAPWMAVLPFDCNGPDQELRLTADQLNGPNAVYKPATATTTTAGSIAPVTVVKQSKTFTVSMTVAEYAAMWTAPAAAGSSTPVATGSTTPVATGSPTPVTANPTKVHMPDYTTDAVQWALIQADTTPVEVIFLSAKLFKSLFTTSSTSTTSNVDPYRYCAHVRDINTMGMADSGGEDTGVFSIVHSLRTGPTDVAQNSPPRSQAVHLISLENIELMTGLDTWGDSDLVALVSLYSWTYLCQPPALVNFVDLMYAIGVQAKGVAGSCNLGSNSILKVGYNNYTSAVDGRDPLQNRLSPAKISTVSSAIGNRFYNGYTLSRYRLASGEESVAFMRGPLLPVSTAATPTTNNWPFASNNGQDYQIFDPLLGIMDISYSTAWQLGKVMAAADLGFVTALMRMRADAHNAGKLASNQAAADLNVGFKSRVAVLSQLTASTDVLRRMTKSGTLGIGEATTGHVPLQQRWAHATPATVQTRSFGASTGVHPAVKAAFNMGVAQAVERMASATVTTTASASIASTTTASAPIASTPTAPAPTASATVDPSVPTDASVPYSAPYNEFNAPNSTDWAFLHSWMLDKLYLSGIPGHYLVTDPSFLPKESIRFFRIDQQWMECYLDGALSVANHMALDDSTFRDSVKTALNSYFSTPIQVTADGVTTSHCPQIPTWGFFLRSAVVTVFPDLRVEVPFPASVPQNGRQPILVQKNVAKDTLIVLLDRTPDGGEIAKIRLSQPPHQQRFSAGDNLTTGSIEFELRKIYTDLPTGTPLPADFLNSLGLQTFNRGDAGSPYNFDTRCLIPSVLQQMLFPGAATGLTSAILGLELYDTMKFLEFTPPVSSVGTVTPAATANLQKKYTLRTNLVARAAAATGAAFPTRYQRSLVTTPHLGSGAMPNPTQKVTHNPLRAFRTPPTRRGTHDTIHSSGETTQSIVPSSVSLAEKSKEQLEEPNQDKLADSNQSTMPDAQEKPEDQAKSQHPVMSDRLPKQGEFASSTHATTPKDMAEPQPPAKSKHSASSAPGKQTQPQVSKDSTQPSTSVQPTALTKDLQSADPQRTVKPGSIMPVRPSEAARRATPRETPVRATEEQVLIRNPPEESENPARPAQPEKTSRPASQPAPERSSTLRDSSILAKGGQEAKLEGSTRSAEPAPETKPTDLLGHLPAVARVEVFTPERLATAASYPGSNIDSSAKDPQYLACIFQSTVSYAAANLGPGKSFIYNDVGYAPDLICSFNRRPPAFCVMNLWICSLALKFPLGDPVKRTQPQGTLYPQLQGAGLLPSNAFWNTRGKMLNNQRWVPHFDAVPGGGYMIVRLIPRSLRGAYPVAVNENLSFLMPEVEIYGARGDGAGAGRQVEVYVRETYGRPTGNPAAPWQDMGYSEYAIYIAIRNGFAQAGLP